MSILTAKMEVILLRVTKSGSVFTEKSPKGVCGVQRAHKEVISMVRNGIFSINSA